MSQSVASSNVVVGRGSWCSLGDEAAKLKSGGCTTSNCSNFACKPTQPPGPHSYLDSRLAQACLGVACAFRACVWWDHRWIDRRRTNTGWRFLGCGLWQMVRLAPSSIERPRERETTEMTGADAKQAEKQAFSGLFFFFGLMRIQKPEGQPLAGR